MSLRFPYLSSAAVIRHTTDRLAFSTGIESEWSDQLRTRVSFEFRRSTDEPLYDDPTASGIGMLEYGGTTTIVAARVDAVANITPIDYFGIALTTHSGRNDRINAQVPYLPGLELSTTYRHAFPIGVTVTAEVGAYTERRAAALASRTAPGGFWSGLKAEYEGVDRLTLFLNFENLLNRKDEVWSGYRVEPFRADVGVSFRW
jgi:outer membrane receptor protein involved in Fe transport